MIIDILILVTVLAFSGVSLYKKRSRGNIWGASIFSLLYFGFFRKGCICAVGTVQNITESFVFGEIPAGAVVFLFLIPVVTALFAGRLFCGSACPLGALQDFISLDRIKVPKYLDRALTFIPPVILYLVVIAVIRGDGYLLCRFDPYISIFRMNAPLDLLIVTVAAVILTLFIARPFCRYLCPYGVVLGIASLFSKWRVDIEPESLCRNCTLCKPACPVDVIRQDRDKEGKVKNPVVLILGVIVILGGVSYLGGVYASAQRWFFEQEAIQLTGELMSKLVIGGRIMGFLTGIAWSAELIALLRPVPSGYAPIIHRCISCARCYNHCPGEVKRVRGRGASK